MTEPTLLFIDLFCGAGGVTSGIEHAKCFDKKIATVLACVNHDYNAITSHQANHPHCLHFTEDIRTLDLTALVAIARHARKQYPDAKLFLWASLECFPEGTMIVTKRGLVDIKDITTNDYVLTHRGRYRKVGETMSKYASTYNVRAQGLPDLETTSEHPFYTKTKTKKWINSIRQYRNEYGIAKWTDTKDLIPDKTMIASPVSFPELGIPVVGGRGFNFTSEFWWLIGRWLGDGSISNRGKNKQITISCGKHEHKFLLDKFKDFLPKQKRSSNGELRFYDRKVRTAVNFDFFHTGLAEWILENFGKLATGNVQLEETRRDESMKLAADKLAREMSIEVLKFARENKLYPEIISQELKWVARDVRNKVLGFYGEATDDQLYTKYLETLNKKV